ncbi:potassium channel subfamily K member 15-like isoform X1 [Scylla paramamosain]|uniref:potassium channel subfamily K member 15-like isoform X1 n=1 Tax=Scylla paramamosain TaxID=85552 RepID=UPI003083E024
MDESQKEKNESGVAGQWRRLVTSEWVNAVRIHVSLLALLVVYTLLGSKIFQVLESSAEKSRLDEAKLRLSEARHSFLGRVERLEALVERERVSGWLREYEEVAEEAQKSGASLTIDSDPRWNFPQAVFFSATVLTTIGYGNIAPETAWGRVFCIVFALVGIPLTLTVLASLGRPLVSLLPVASIERLLPKGRMKTAVTILATLSLLVSFLALGGLLFMWLDSRTFMEAFYFCFITTTTIGFGDIVPESTETAFIICCLVYILVGLALTTTVIELVQRQYASSWAEMKHLTARLHALSGPLASAMRKLAEGGAGEVEVNPELVRELRDLNVTLAEVQRRGSASGTPPSGTPAKPDPWEALLRSTLTRRRIKLVIVRCWRSVQVSSLSPSYPLQCSHSFMPHLSAS